MKIEPCPHCGSASPEVEGLFSGEGKLFVECSNCGARGPAQYHEVVRRCTCCLPEHDPHEVERASSAAIAAWNRMSLAVQLAESLAWRDEALDASEWAWNEWSDLAMHKGIEELDSTVDAARAELRRLLAAWEAL